jgi:hypothetical protein
MQPNDKISLFVNYHTNLVNYFTDKPLYIEEPTHTNPTPQTHRTTNKNSQNFNLK